MLKLLLLMQLVAVIDGDTIKLDGERVRLLGVDAPEIHHAQCPAERRRGESARGHLQDLLEGRHLTLVRHGKDRYRRTLGIILADGADINAAMIASHHAVRWDGQKHDWCR